MEELLKKLEVLVNTIEKSQSNEAGDIKKSLEGLQEEIKKAGGLSEEDKAKLAKMEELEAEIKKQAQAIDEMMKAGTVTGENTEEELAKTEKELNAYFKTGEMTETIKKVFNTAGGEAGSLIPKPRQHEIIKSILETSPVLRMAKRYSISKDGNNLVIPVKNTGGKNTAAQQEGAGKGSESTLTYTKLELKVGKITDYTTVTAEMIADSDFNIVSEVMENAKENMASYLSDKVWNGTIGSYNEIEGIYQCSGVTSAALETGTQQVLAWEDLKNMIYKLKPSVRAKSYFIVSTDALSKMRGFKDKNDRPLYIDPLTAGEPGTFMGYKVYEDTYMQTVAGNQYPVFFGDMSKFYAWLDKKGIYLEKERNADNDTTTFYTRMRIGGRVRQKEYGLLLKIKNG